MIDWLHILLFLLGSFLIYAARTNLSKQNKKLNAVVEQQRNDLRKYENWHRTWQLASPEEASRLKPPLIPNKSYKPAKYSKPAESKDKPKAKKSTDNTIQTEKWKDRELEWNKED